MKKLFIQALKARELLKELITPEMVSNIKDAVEEVFDKPKQDIAYYKHRIEALEGLVEAQQRAIAELSK